MNRTVLVRYYGKPADCGLVFAGCEPNLSPYDSLHGQAWANIGSRTWLDSGHQNFHVLFSGHHEYQYFFIQIVMVSSCLNISLWVDWLLKSLILVNECKMITFMRDYVRT